MEEWTEIRRKVLVEGVSQRSILRETGMHWKTLEKILNHSAPPGYQQSQPRKRTRIGPFVERIAKILKEDLKLPKKQRHTARRIWERIRDESGYRGSYTTVNETVRGLRSKNEEVFVALKRAGGF